MVKVRVRGYGMYCVNERPHRDRETVCVFVLIYQLSPRGPQLGADGDQSNTGLSVGLNDERI